VNDPKPGRGVGKAVGERYKEVELRVFSRTTTAAAATNNTD
jgi:hypothetical protein